MSDGEVLEPLIEAADKLVGAVFRSVGEYGDLLPKDEPDDSAAWNAVRELLALANAVQDAIAVVDEGGQS